MNLNEIIKQAQKLAIDNSPAILTAIGVTGTLTTAYLTGKASFKAAKILSDMQYTENINRGAGEIRHELSTKEKAKLIWKLYIPAISTGVITCTAVVFANRIGSRRAAAMAAAFSLSERAFDEYKGKIVETIGKNKERAVHDEIAQDRVTNNPVSKNQVIVTGSGDVLCYDMYTGRYFESSMEKLNKARNDLNYDIINDGYASLTDFYSKIRLSGTKNSDDVGWRSDRLLELIITTTMSEDNRPCLAMDFAVAPVPNYFRVH